MVQRAPDLADFIFGDFPSRLMLILVSIFTAFFIGTELSTGYIKNITRVLRNRKNLVLSKLFTITVFNVLFFFTYIITILVASFFLLGPLDFTNTGEHLSALAAEFLLHVAFSSLIMLITYIFRSVAVSITAGTLISVNILSVLYSKVDILFKGILASQFDTVMYYTITGNVSFIGLHSTKSMCLNAIVVAAIYIILTTFISMKIVEKRDI